MLHDPRHIPVGKHMGRPVVGAVAAVKALQAAGHELVVFSHRGGKPDHVEAWLRFFGFPRMLVTDRKADYDVIIDDHAVTFIDWEEALAEIGVDVPV